MPASLLLLASFNIQQTATEHKFYGPMYQIKGDKNVLEEWNNNGSSTFPQPNFNDFDTVLQHSSVEAISGLGQPGNTLEHLVYWKQPGKPNPLYKKWLQQFQCLLRIQMHSPHTIQWTNPCKACAKTVNFLTHSGSNMHAVYKLVSRLKRQKIICIL